MKKLKQYSKEVGLRAFKGAGLTAEQLAKINGYTLREHNAEEIYARRLLLAHNGIDRDNERFPEKMLDDFAKTLPGKGLLMGHSRPGPGSGLFFEAYTKEITPREFKSLTGEDIKLPEGIEKAKVLWGWFYALAAYEELTQNLEAGIYRHVSIGFSAADLVAVKDDVNGPVTYWEYVPPGEAREGSIVWLGAQQGATVQKAIAPEEKATPGREGNPLSPHSYKTDEIGDKKNPLTPEEE